MLQHGDSNGRVMESNCSVEKKQLFATLISKRPLSECGLRWIWMQAFSGVLLVRDSWKLSFLTHLLQPTDPHTKTGGKNGIVLKIKLGYMY